MDIDKMTFDDCLDILRNDPEAREYVREYANLTLASAYESLRILDDMEPPRRVKMRWSRAKRQWVEVKERINR